MSYDGGGGFVNFGNGLPSGGVDLTSDVTGVLPIANGGTGASTFTQGSIPFMGATVLEQDNANLFWDNSNDRLGAGIDVPLATGHFRASASGADADPSAVIIIEKDFNPALQLMSGGNAHIYFGVSGSSKIGRITHFPATKNITVYANSLPRVTFEGDGTLSADTASYETLVTSDKDFTNKKYVDDGIVSGNFWSRASTDTTMKNTGDNLGVGTASPAGKLHVQPSTASGLPVGDLIVESSGTATFQMMAGNASTCNINFGDEDNSNVGNINYNNSGNILSLTRGTGMIDIFQGNVVINEDSADADFRVEGNTDANLLFVDGGNDRVGIKTSAPASLFHIDDGASGVTPSANTQVMIEGSAQAGLTIATNGTGQAHIFFGDSGDNDIGRIEYFHNGNIMEFTVNAAEWLRADGTEAVFNEGSGDRDFRVETNGATHAIFAEGGTDRVGIGQATPLSTLHVEGDIAAKIVNITDAASPYDIGAAFVHTVICDATSGVITVDLPAAASSNGRMFVIKKSDVSANAVTVDGNASETIDGATTQVLSSQYDFIKVHCDGTEWWIISN